MSLLARNAEQLFWLARYIERAGSLARIIETHSSYGRASADEFSWAWLVSLYSNEKRFAEDYDEASFKNVIRFYVGDIANPGSVPFSVKAARENARALRAVIPTEMWRQLNGFYNRLTALGAEDFDLVGLSRTCGIIKDGCYAQLGVAESTLYRDEGERFFRLGLMIERADQTSRLLDVKFAQLATAKSATGPTGDATFWAVILRSAAAYQAFRRHEPYGGDPSRVAKFLLVNPNQPRSVAYCVSEMRRALEDLRSSYHLRKTAKLLERVEVLLEGLQSAADDPTLVVRLHSVNDWLQQRLVEFTADLDAAFFSIDDRSAPAPLQASTSQTQSQSQSQPAPPADKSTATQTLS